MKELTDLEDLGFDVTFVKHETHPHRYTCTVRRWNSDHTKFKQGTFQWINENQFYEDQTIQYSETIKYLFNVVKPSHRLKRYFKEHFFDIERITGLKINWTKYDELPIFTQ